MKPVVTAGEMKGLDRNTIESAGVPGMVLMERAALKTVEAMEKYLGNKDRVLVVCGNGNNGGDGMAIARLLHLKGIKVGIYLAGQEEKLTDQARQQLQIAKYYQVPLENNLQPDEYTIIVDALFGVGLSRPVEGRYAEIIHMLNQSGAFRVAVDIPSGINGDTGREMGIGFRADLTVTFAFCKRGLCFYPGRMYAGELIVADIGIYANPDRDPSMAYLEKEDLSMLPSRIPWGNKGTFGKVLLIAGSRGMCGASCLSSAAALRASAGMVKVQTVEENRISLQSQLPEVMVTCEFNEKSNQEILDWCDVLVIGPGLGMSGESRERVQWFLSHAAWCGKPVILDADGLNLLAVHGEWKKYLGEQVILTPHLGEMSRLTGKSIGEIRENLAETASLYAEETHTVCVLKDACTVVASEKGEQYLNMSGNAGMATAGSGDVLSGVLAGVLCMFLAAEKKPAYGQMAALGVLIHGLAGDMAAENVGERGMTARDIIRFLPEVLKVQ